MMGVANHTDVWITVRWQCDCGRWALWKATPERLERHGLEPFELAWGRTTIQVGIPPATASDVLQGANFTCLCGRRVPVVETIKALLQFSAPILWQAPKPPAPAPAPALRSLR